MGEKGGGEGEFVLSYGGGVCEGVKGGRGKGDASLEGGRVGGWGLSEFEVGSSDD